MAKNPKKPVQPTKKHIARLERERIQKRYLIIGSIIVVVLVVGLILYAFIDQMYLQSRRSVAIVNGTQIIASDFQGQTRLARYNMIQSAYNVFQLAQIMGNDASSLQPVANQLQSIDGQLFPTAIGGQVLDQMIDDILIKEEANNLGITVSENEINQEIEQAFGYYRDGSSPPATAPDIIPTSTLTELQKSLIPSTTTSTPINEGDQTGEGESNQATETLDTPSPQPTQTPISLQDFNNRFQETTATLESEYNITQNDMRSAFESDLYKQKVMDQIVTDVKCESEQAWAFHILVDDETLANDIKSRLDEGEDWALMASTYSTDESNKDNNGDLGWFERGVMVPEFDEAVFSLDIGETSDPVKTQFGWHIIRKIGQENRPLSEQECQQLRTAKLNEWLIARRENSDIQKLDYWRQVVPDDPSLPLEIKQFINTYLNATAPAP